MSGHSQCHRPRAKVHATGRALLVMMHRRQRMFGICHDTPAMRDQLAAGGCGNGTLADALNKLHLAAILQFTDLLADGRLRQMQTLRRLGKAAKLNHFDQRTQLVEVQVTGQSGEQAGSKVPHRGLGDSSHQGPQRNKMYRFQRSAIDLFSGSRWLCLLGDLRVKHSFALLPVHPIAV